MPRDYNVVSQELRKQLYHEVKVKKSSVVDAARKLQIKYSTAKSIVRRNAFELKERGGTRPRKTTP